MSSPIVYSDDVQLAKNFPSFEYNPGETSGVYHEDREISGAMYRAANATYNDLGGFWSLPRVGAVFAPCGCHRCNPSTFELP